MRLEVRGLHEHQALAIIAQKKGRIDGQTAARGYGDGEEHQEVEWRRRFDGGVSLEVALRSRGESHTHVQSRIDPMSVVRICRVSRISRLPYYLRIREPARHR